MFIGENLLGRYDQYLNNIKREAAKRRIETEIRSYLYRRTLTFGANEALQMESIDFDWPDHWRTRAKPKLQLVVRVTDPAIPSNKQVQEIQNRINNKLSENFPGLQMQMQMQVLRIKVSVVSGRDVPETIDLDQILNQSEDIAERTSVSPSDQLVEVESNPPD